MGNRVIEKLAEIYPQLYLNPDKDPIESYRAIVLRGEQPLFFGGRGSETSPPLGRLLLDKYTSEKRIMFSVDVISCLL